MKNLTVIRKEIKVTYSFNMKPKRKIKICSRAHEFYKTSDCPVCPVCWSGFYRKKVQSDFPKLSAPALRALQNAKIINLARLSKYTEDEVLNLHGLGPSSLPILKAALKTKKLSFKK